jgi:hypothetical protein
VPRADGYAYGLATIQGVRAFDSAAGIWTTPDAYAGDVDDPGSQKSYMWNGNNCQGRRKSPRLGRCKIPYPISPIGRLVRLTSLPFRVV